MKAGLFLSCLILSLRGSRTAHHHNSWSFLDALAWASPELSFELLVYATGCRVFRVLTPPTKATTAPRRGTLQAVAPNQGL